MKNLIFILLLIFVTAAAAQTRENEAEEAVNAALDAHFIAWNTGNIDGFMKTYRNSPDMTFVSGDTVTKGWQPTLERYKKNYDTRAKMGMLSFVDLEVTILSNDAAMVIGGWDLRRVDDPRRGRFTLIFRKFKDGWKIVYHHTS